MKNDSSSHRLFSLDVLRVIAVAGVVMAHYFWSERWVTDNLRGSPKDVFGGLAAIGSYGFLGVHLFFIISGTVIARSAMCRNAREFVLARFFRIMPAFFIAVLLSAVFLLAGGEKQLSVVLRSIPTNLVLSPSLAQTGWLNPVFWTLLVEVSFYAIVALMLLIWGSSRQVLWRFAWIWLGVTFLISRTSEETIRILALSDWAPFFIIGMLIGTAQTKSDKFLASIGTFSATLLAIDSTLSTMDPNGRSSNFIYLLIFLLVILVSIAVWFEPVAKLRSSKWALTGTMTYSIYLFHVIPGRNLAEYLLNLGWHFPEAYTLSWLAVVLISFLVTKFCEPPIRGYLRRFAKD